MKRRLFKLLLALLAGAVVLPVRYTLAQDQTKKKTPPAQQQQEQEPEYTEEEYDAYEKATHEPDLDKRAPALTAFMDKYPKSKLQTYIVAAYQQLLFDCQKNKKYTELGTHAERWLKYFPNDLATNGYIADAAQNLGQDKKFIEYALKVYSAKPDKTLAYALTTTYKRVGDQAKYFEWAENCFPDFPGDFELRMVFVDKYMKDKNFAKAAEYAHLTLKSLEVAKRSETTSEEVWQKAVTATKFKCNYIIGLNQYDKKKYAEAMKSMEKCLAIDKKFDWAYYYIGHCQRQIAHSQSNWDMMEEAILSFAKAVVLKGEAASQAKEQLETVYKPMHNNTLVGVDKKYAKAAQELGITWNGAN